MRADDTWTDDRIAVLKAMWAAGATATAIAERLGGLSRSAVLGKISRLRLRADASAAAANQAPAAATTSPDLALLQRRRHNRKRTRRSLPKPRR
ncbi:MAG TPA: GcrA family cell cycle regulator, partial [Xanthobacteraceae bacterium]|nr:GcrA family cell cycle regulator [Xanthobacteraceae bacterium]